MTTHEQLENLRTHIESADAQVQRIFAAEIKREHRAKFIKMSRQIQAIARTMEDIEQAHIS